MDTHGHEDCAEDAGLPLLEAALAQAGKRGWRTNAFYLGNWITDVQQAVDPGPYAEVANAVRSGIDGLVDAVLEMEVVQQVGWIRSNLADPLHAFRARIHAAASALDGGQQSRVAGIMRKAFLVRGYFKFVHPERRGGRARMDYSAFRHVFDTAYTQYYPHEHLDRFPKYNVTASEQKTRTPEGHGSGSDPLRPHIYDYLIDDVQIAAGLIAWVDREWARRTFAPNGRPWPDGDGNHDWNWGLARLGHAIHAVEDYFAHSNFVEHAMAAKGQALRQGHGGEVFRKRLTQLRRDGSIGGAEPHVVTGYFDKWDTLHSLAHVVEELGLQVEAHRDAMPAAPQVHGRGPKIGRLMVALVRDIQDGEPTRAAAEAALRRLASGGDPDVDHSVQEAAQAVQSRLPAEAGEIKDALLDTVVALATAIPGSTLTLLDGLILLAEFHERLMYPWRFLTWMVSELPAGAARWVVEHVLDPAEDRIREPFERAVRRQIEARLGRFRVGSHSLLAKDYAWPHEDEINRLHGHAMNLAKAVHWYVVKCLTRHADPPPVPLTRGAFEDRDDDNCSFNALGSYCWIDWLELCEFFLRHPSGSHPVRSSPTIAEQWWSQVIDGGAFASFPGYTAARPGRDGELPHSLVFIQSQALDDQIQAAQQLRSQAEQAYQP